MIKKKLFVLAAITCCTILCSFAKAQDTAVSYTYQGTTLYYCFGSSQASVVAPMYPNIPSNVDTVDTWAGYSKPKGAVVIPDSVPYCGSNYPVTVINNAAFLKCDSITSLTLPSTLSVIGSKSMRGCSNLTSIDIPEGTLGILSNAFNGCMKLQRVSFPSTLTSLGSSVFYNCRALDTVSLPGSLTTMGSSVFGQCLNLRCVILNEGITTISSGAFVYCLRLSDIRFPSTLKTIDQVAFANNDSLTVLTLPEGLTLVKNSAFNNCNGLRSVSLPSTLDTIKDKAFENCDLLDTIIVKSPTPHYLDSNAFSSFDATLIVPCGYKNEYSSHPIWGNFVNISEDCVGVEEIDDEKRNIEIHVKDGIIVVDGAYGETVRIYDILGRPVNNHALPKGIYLVKIGIYPAQKVVVF